MKKNKTAVGICTYKRPQMFAKCLESILLQKIPENVSLSILIADNDSEESGRTVFENLKKKTEIPMSYSAEKKQGIPFARNNILEQAEKENIDLLLFLDDDEYADPFWLTNLYKYYIESGCDVIRGYVKTDYPDDTPSWIVKGLFYQRRNRQTGEMMESASTNNVLFDFKKVCINWNVKFDEAFALKGGSDSDFFKRAFLKGAKITWLSDAVVYETLEKERFKLSYLLKRKFRTRNGKAFFQNITAKLWIKTFFSAVLRIIKGIIFLPSGIIKGKHFAVNALCEISAGTGRLLGLFRIHPGWDEYGKKE